MIPPPNTPKQPTASKKISFEEIGSKKGQRIVLYGTGGIGKTTLSCLAPGKVAFIDADDSLPILKKTLLGMRFPMPMIIPCSDWQSIREALKSDGFDSIGTIVIDTATRLEEMATTDTLRRVKKENNSVASSVEDYGYGKGYTFVYDTFCTILGDLEKHVRAGRNVILIAHECTAPVPNPNGEDWIRYEPRLQSPSTGKNSIRNKVKEWADHVLFIGYDVSVNKEGKASGAGTRTLYTAEMPTFMAKSRTTSKTFDIDLGTNPWPEILL